MAAKKKTEPAPAPKAIEHKVPRRHRAASARWIELPTNTIPYWTVNQARAALDQQEIGLLQESALLFEAMDRDDRIKAVLDTRVNGLLGLPVTVTPAAHPDREKARYVASIVRERWRDWFPEGDLAQLLRWAIGVGIGLGENRWRYEDGFRVPYLKVWHPQFLYWQWDLNDWDGGWALTTMGKQSGPNSELRINTDGNGSIRGSGTQVQPVPGDGTWVTVQPYGRRRPWQGGLVRSLTRPYLVRGYAYRDWARWSETLGGGIKKAMVPSSAKTADKTMFFSSLSHMGANGIILLPQSMEAGKETSFNLELLNTQSSEAGGSGFNLLIKQTDTSIAIAVLGQNLTTEVKGGSFAAARVHESVKTDIASTDAMNLMGAIRRCCLAPFARDNFGDATLAPIISINVGPPTDQTVKAKTMLTVAQALQAFDTTMPDQIDKSSVTEDFDIPLVVTAPDRGATEELPGSAGSDSDPVSVDPEKASE